MKRVLLLVASRDSVIPEEWYIAADHGERVTLAALHGRGLIVRRARRGVEGEADAAYAYRLSDVMRDALSVRVCQHCGTSAAAVSAGRASRLCNRGGLAAGHSYLDRKAVTAA